MMTLENDTELKVEWDKEAVVNKLREEICEVTFTKVNGEQRIMQCTLKSSLIPVVESTEANEAKKTKKENPSVLAVFDVTAGGWRSFKWDLLKDFKGGAV